jgi:hypothetical protein
MSDSKVSELTSATSLGVSDYLYVVQSNASKKITAATMFANAANVTLSGNLNLQSSVQLVTSAGTTIDLTKPISHLAADASGGTIFMPAGTTNQIKYGIIINTIELNLYNTDIIKKLISSIINFFTNTYNNEFIKNLVKFNSVYLSMEFHINDLILKIQNELDEITKNLINDLFSLESEIEKIK